MKKLLLLSALLGFIAAPALGQTALGTIGPGAVPCAYTNCIFGNGTKTTPSVSFAGATGNGWYWRAGVGLALAGNSGKEIIQFGSSGGIATGGSSIGVIAGGGGDVSTTSTNTIWTSNVAATWQSGSTDVDTAPVAQTFRSQGAAAGGTSNVAGADWTFIASPGKGTGVGGTFIFQTTPAGSSGTVVGTPTTVMTLTGPGAITMPRVTTGTNADFLCLSAGAVVLLQTSACTISSMRFKENINLFTATVSSAMFKLPVVTFKLKSGAQNKDPNAKPVELGLLAEDVAKIVPICAIYENDMKTPKSYRQECLIAALVKTVQEQHAANDNLARRVAVLERRR